MLTKIISGGQTGADRGGLIAAKNLGLKTGGWMPKGMFAQDGKHPEFINIYGMSEHSSPKYPPRTALNVKESDGTIRIASDFNSPGEILTLKMINQYGKPHLDIWVSNPPQVHLLIDWLNRHNIQTLNVAGNSERTCPGIQDFTINYLTETIYEIRLRSVLS